MAGKRGEVSVLAAVEKLEASTVSARTEGLEGLRQIFGQDRAFYRIDELGDTSFHKILESLFRIVRSEKPNYIRAASSRSKEASKSRLASAATALRVIVDAVGSRLKQKTASAVLDHIVDTLPDVEGGFCQPIQLDYLKSFSILLSYGSRSEHLRPKQWQAYVDFITANIDENLENIVNGSHISSGQPLSVTSKNELSMRVKDSQASSSRTQHQIIEDEQAEFVLVELLIALKHLTGITNAPLITRFRQILRLVLHWLETISRSEEIAFEILNNNLPVALSEDIALAATIFNDVVRLIRQRDLWSKKSMGSKKSTAANKYVILKENILSTMILCRSLFLSAAGTSLMAETSLEHLQQSIQHDYHKMKDRDRLRMDDLGFSHPSDSFVLSINGINLISEDPQAVNNWCTILVIACMLVGISTRLNLDRGSDEDSAHKRRRLENPIDDLFREALNTNAQIQLMAIPIALFIVDLESAVSEATADLLSRIQLTDLDDEPVVASWMCLLLARIAFLDEELSLQPDFWKRVWSWASRASAVTAVTRPACYLLYAMTQSKITRHTLSGLEVCHDIFSDGISGPNALTDAAILLLLGVMTSNLLDTEKSFRHFATHCLRWIDSQWVISTVPDRHNSQIALFARSDDLFVFLMSLTGIPTDLERSQILMPPNSICKALITTNEDLAFAQYILSDVQPQPKRIMSQRRAYSAYLPSLSVLGNLRQSVIEVLGTKVKSFYIACKAAMDERASVVYLGLMESASTACVLCSIATQKFGSEQDWILMQPSITQLWELVCTFLEGLSGEDFTKASSKVAARLTSVQFNDLQAQCLLSAYREHLTTKLNEVFVQKFELQEKLIVLDRDFLDSAESQTSRSSQQSSSQAVIDAVRTDIAVACDIKASSARQRFLERSEYARQRFLLRLDLARAKAGRDLNASFGAMAVDVITSLTVDELLVSRDIIVKFLDQGNTMARTDLGRLLTRMAQVCLQEEELERCEATLCLCLRITMRLTPFWATEQDDDLANVGYDVYQWFVKIALGKGIASQRVLLCIATLLQSIMRCNPSYGAETLPSARTSLLQILSNGHTSLKFQLLDQLSNLFNGYVLSEHPAIFDDIIENLPSDPDRIEGIGLRLYIIASLGAEWHTILRQSVYHIFETAANVPPTTDVAAKCVQMVRRRLELESPQRLLQLFSPQVLYTWLDSQNIGSIPYRVFGYTSLIALQREIQDELVAQIAMRNSTEKVQIVVQALGKSWDGLIERWFAKVVAYAIITDIAVQRASRDIGKAEMSLVQHLGEEVYAKLCRMNFASAVSTIFLRFSDDKGFEKVSSQGEIDHQFAVTHRLICDHSSSQIQLPPGQQPSFRAKHLIPILDRMCMRAQETLDSVWTPALLLHVYRVLLADAKSAFGPLHTCAILRKIRVVICLAGQVALSGHPLQMILHTLRPFLTQFHSSEDAFGIFWYLLEHGKDHLKQKLSFVTGLSVAIFAALSRFASSAQDSTTQESHFTSTMTKAQEFRLWLGSYLEGFDATGLDEVAALTFTEIVQAAKKITKDGSSAKATAEGSLLYHLLADQALGRPLLSKTFFRLTLRSLCYGFTPVVDFQDDILYADRDVLRIAPVLWSILSYQGLPNSFRTWVSQALGRAYALEGPRIIEANGSQQHSDAPSDKLNIIVEDSYQSIANILADLSWDENVSIASASEATLQSIFSALSLENKAMVLGTAVDQSMFDELRFVDLPCPSIYDDSSTNNVDLLDHNDSLDGIVWAGQMIKKLAEQQVGDPILSFLPAMIDLVPSIAPMLLPHVVHLALHLETDSNKKTHDLLTESFGSIFGAERKASRYQTELALRTVTHLRRCVLTSESTMAKRNTWLGIDFAAAAAAALSCKMYRTALLMLEIHVSQHNLAASRSSRRSSHNDTSMVFEVRNRIYRHIDDLDFFYGTHEESDVASIVEKLCHEGHGYKALSFQSALFDSNIRTGGVSSALKTSGRTTMSALNLANLSGISNSIGSFVASENQDNILEHNLQSLLNLNQWDIAQDRAISDHGRAIMTAFKTLSSASQRETILDAVDQSSLELGQLLLNNIYHQAQRVNYWTSLAILAELKETLSTTNSDDLEALLQKWITRRAWTEQESFECIEPILLGREAIFATIKGNPQIRTMMAVTAPEATLLEIKAFRASLRLGHVHEMSQFCLNRAAHLKELLPLATKHGVRVEAAIQYDLANTFWAQQETAASIRILQSLHERKFPDQAIEVHQAEILTDLGFKITEARLDRPDEVTAKYLVPAINALGKETMGSKGGRVFHNFAAFCDSQLRDPDNVDEYDRIEKIRDRKLQEVLELESMYKKGDAKTRDTVKAHFSKAKTWFKLDDEELQRLKAHRDRLVRNCLENYLLSLRACEDFPNDVLRFLALWMEQSASAAANVSVSKYLTSVPTYKFAPLMNQLSSRILSEESPFQQLLTGLMYHVCEDHPFHSLYQLFATSKSKGAQKDEVANSRHAAATKLSEKVMKKSSASNLWVSIHNSNIQFVRVAQERMSDKELKTGSKLLLRKLTQGAKLEQTIHDMHYRIPPPTMKVDIRADKNYSSVATIARFDPQISIAGGVSAPKIITVIASDGSRHKMLLKGGNDDLRQDSIMEQVFEQVSNLLKDHRPTRQRKLGIRTYKVIPLTHNAGIIEFVKDTMPLHDYVLPAHTRYYPKDYKPNKCRKDIADAQAKSPAQRLQAYQNVVSNFHPVMRFFFMEHFLDPDDWFQKRLNYSRSTAAISMLGHVLGLGDRHGHNILLDTKTGEVVHIDLGVAFEAGRVLPVPEVVPFRLTRDLVDGMGLSGVNGVFRRCCNFTLEALRRNQEAIMTILDVLRWDPLYSWSVSPLRLARMQENQEQAANANAGTDASTAGTSDVSTSTMAGLNGATKRNNVNEPSEADRALAIVSKKLGKSLSVEATVNELIRQAMDERNLAVLYCGWAAYA